MTKYVPLIVRCGIVLLLVVLLIVLSILKNNPEVCEAMSRGLSRFIVGVMGKGSEVASFSLTEVAFVLLAIGLVTLLVLSICSLVKKHFLASLHRVLELGAILLLSFNLYDLSCEFAYKRDEMPLPYYEQEVERTEHIGIYNYFASDVNYCISQLEFKDSGEVRRTMSLEQLTKEVKKAYHIIDGNSYFSSSFGAVKPMASSFIYREFQITGVTYSPLGEANINILNTTTNLPLTVAHELAHTKGVMREDDANKLAFYVCLNSDHPYLRYSAYASYFYQMDAIVTSYYLTDDERTNLVSLDSTLGKTRSYEYLFWKEHDLLGDIGNWINNLYIKSSGVKEGTTSYSGGTTYEHDPTTSKLIPSLYQKLFFEKYYRS